MAHKEWCGSWYMSSETNQPYPCNCGADLDAALARAAEAEARAVLLTAALDEYGVHAVGCDATTGRYTACTCGLDRVRSTSPGPLLALMQLTARLASGVHRIEGGNPGMRGDDFKTLRRLVAAWDVLPAWLQGYLTREAGDAEPR